MQKKKKKRINKGATQLRSCVAASFRGTKLAAEQLAVEQTRLLATIKSELCGEKKTKEKKLKINLKKKETQAICIECGHTHHKFTFCLQHLAAYKQEAATDT